MHPFLGGSGKCKLPKSNQFIWFLCRGMFYKRIKNITCIHSYYTAIDPMEFFHLLLFDGLFSSLFHVSGKSNGNKTISVELLSVEAAFLLVRFRFQFIFAGIRIWHIWVYIFENIRSRAKETGKQMKTKPKRAKKENNLVSWMRDKNIRQFYRLNWIAWMALQSKLLLIFLLLLFTVACEKSPPKANDGRARKRESEKTRPDKWLRYIILKSTKRKLIICRFSDKNGRARARWPVRFSFFSLLPPAVVSSSN